MAPTDPELARDLARLARLALNAEELGAHAEALERILAAFEVLARQASPTLPENATGTLVREDSPLPSLPPEELLAAAPARQDGFYVVPKTVGNET